VRSLAARKGAAPVSSKSPETVKVLVLRDERSSGHSPGESLWDVEPVSTDSRLTIISAGAGREEALQAAKQHLPGVIVIDSISDDPAQVVGALEEALEGTVPVLVILEQADQNRVQDCLAAGARG